MWPVVLQAIEAGHLTRKEAAKKLGVRYTTFQRELSQHVESAELKAR